MTVPMIYAHASEHFDRFMVEARDALALATRHQTFTVVEAVLWVFRDRLDPVQVALFAQCLPAILRAIFIEGWDPRIRPLTFAGRPEMTRAVQSVRQDHNLAPDDCIVQVARVLRCHVDAREFEAVLGALRPEASAFWSVSAS